MAENVQKYVEQNPFGQHAITESNPSWGFYRKIMDTITNPPQDSASPRLWDANSDALHNLQRQSQHDFCLNYCCWSTLQGNWWWVYILGRTLRSSLSSTVNVSCLGMKGPFVYHWSLIFCLLTTWCFKIIHVKLIGNLQQV